MTLPLYPLYIVDIIGSAVVGVFSLLSVSISLRLFRRDRENILHTYLLWFSIVLAFFASSRVIGHILQHLLVFSGMGDIWKSLSPISGSINTLSFIFVGTISLFFLKAQEIHEKVIEDKRRLEQLNIELMNLNQDMEALISERTLNMIALSVADKVRNPATVIGGTVQRILRTEGLSEPLKRRLMDFLQESQKLDAIVKDYEMILKTRQSFFKYEDIVEIIKGIVPLVEREIREKSIVFDIKLPEAPIKCNANRQLLRIAILHILKNAIEATPEGGRITLSCGMTDENVYIDITDTGKGIPEEDIPKIFSLFFSTKKHRLGMGLPIVKQIMEEHKGAVRVQSKLGEGSTFRLIIPTRWKEQSLPSD